ncbi:MAG TPA: gluconate 2-dehydrogenase subunit 3 family protein [Kofleriaceae bacterium]
MPALTRRDLFRLVGGAAVLAQLPACGDNAGDRVFTSAELNMLYALANVIIPPDDKPGGAELGAIAYIEALVTAFQHTPPMIYAGGPSSDRAGGNENDFLTFVELDRVSHAAWQLDTMNIKQQLVDGLAAARALNISDPAALYDSLDDDFRTLVFELVTEAAWAAPEYGGNPNLAGWAMIHFEGDSLPMGYSQWNGSGYSERGEAPMSTPNPSDPEPLDDDVSQVISEVVAFLGGQTFT